MNNRQRKNSKSLPPITSDKGFNYIDNSLCLCGESLATEGYSSRRELLKIGGLSLFGFFSANAAGLFPLGQVQGGTSKEKNKKKSNRCIWIFLQGGASHIDLWDPKPMAPQEVRGPFRTIQTALQGGIRFTEILPFTASIADQITVIRSMRHSFTNHIAGTYIAHTGSTNQPDADREAASEDFPGPGPLLNMLAPSSKHIPSSVAIPNWLSIPGPSNRMPGQYGGFIGSTYDSFLISGDPNQKNYNPPSLKIPGELTNSRIAKRVSLRNQLEDLSRGLDQANRQRQNQFTQAALSLVTDPKIREAVELEREPQSVRDRYGRTKIGQSLLLARRLLEAGIRMVSYNDFNQHWDTHGDLKKRYQHIVPELDRAYSALIEDLKQRGLIESTLVVNMGEFGRTPTVNGGAGRDHWPFAYSAVLAGGGIKQGLVYGSSDSRGAQVATQPVSPADLLATFWHLMGIDPTSEIKDRNDRPYLLSTGKPIEAILQS